MSRATVHSPECCAAEPEASSARIVRVRNTFIDTCADRSPSLERFYRERAAQSCPSERIGHLKAAFQKMRDNSSDETESATPLDTSTDDMQTGSVGSDACTHYSMESLPEARCAVQPLALEELAAEDDVASLGAAFVLHTPSFSEAGGEAFAHSGPRAVISIADAIDQPPQPAGPSAAEALSQRTCASMRSVPYGGHAVPEDTFYLHGGFASSEAMYGLGSHCSPGYAQTEVPDMHWQPPLDPMMLMMPMGADGAAAATAPRQGVLDGSVDGWPVPAHAAPAQMPDVAMPAGVRAQSGAKMPPPPPSTPAVGTAEMPSIGSAAHGSGECKPCAFFHQGRCGNGLSCKFCHLCDADEKKRRRKEKMESRRSTTR